MGIEQEYGFSQWIRNQYFKPGQLGDIDEMLWGAIDVSS